MRIALQGIVDRELIILLDCNETDLTVNAAGIINNRFIGSSTPALIGLENSI